MSAGTSEFFCLICLLVCSCTAQKIITAEVGQDVILPCKAPNIKNINDIRALEWIRPDLDPEYVLLYRNKRFDPDSQNPSYQNRVDLQDKEMKDGDASLILKNVTMEDTGTYMCQVSQKTKKDLISTIFLKVYLSAQEIITAELGQDVILPCKVPNINNINDITAVGWKRPGLNPEYVLLYRDGLLDPDNQHPSYQNRVDLQDKEMKDGDVSLILKNVKKNDTGIYECQVFEKGKKDLISIIYLEVHPSDHSWMIIVGVVVPLVVITLLILAGVHYVCTIRLISERKKEWQEMIEQLKINISETNNQLQQQETEENETLENELEELKRSNSDIISQLQQEKQRNEKAESEKKTLQDQLEELRGSNSDIINQLQQEKQKNEKAESEKKILQDQLKKGNNPETISLLQQEKQKNEALKNEKDKKLKRSHSDASSELQWVKKSNKILESYLKELEPLAAEGP